MLAALGNSFVNHRNGWRNVFPYQFLRSDQTVRQSVYSQFIIFGTQDHYLDGLDAECTPKRSRDNNPPLLVDARMTFLPIDDIANAPLRAAPIPRLPHPCVFLQGWALVKPGPSSSDGKSTSSIDS